MFETRIERYFGLLLVLILGTIPTLGENATSEPAREWSILISDLHYRTAIVNRAQQTLRRESLIYDSDRDPLDIVLRRSAALLANIKLLAGAPSLAEQEKNLSGLATEAQAIAATDVEKRRELFSRVLPVRRAIAFSNPLLNFKELVFITRQRALFDHMCDQYYGIAARPGGRLCVLSDPFGSKPVARDLLAGSTVSKGRLAGQKVDGGPQRWWENGYDGMGNLSGEETQGGSFLSPELSFDGKTILFAYVECQGDRHHREHTDSSRGHWAEGRSYHIFKVDVDGKNLVQLTDGTWNDFDPCYLPNGRIAFISERRGGYLRCGRVCPTYTLYDMEADGSDIEALSYHETNEWQPSVTPDGMIIFTRWDYVDRHGCTAHGPWLITPDGRDPRAMEGNYTTRASRPDMQLDVRAIPDSHRFVATAAPHHGQAYGSLVMIDPRLPDDEQMSGIKRITPEVGFPESQGGKEVFGEAWPLSEDYYLCSYDPAMQITNIGNSGLYGLYLVDSFGNKELIYREADIGCHSPIPLRARAVPPVVPQLSDRKSAGPSAEAVVGVANVYDSLKQWPANTRITGLRVYQILPLSVASAAVPHNTGIQIPQGSDSVNLARAVLGEVPVEKDGSAHFVVPARKELYFQALNEEGLAVTSMRSAAQFQPGEKALCQGCHEPRQGAPRTQNASPLAMRRAPSRLVPGPDGSKPFSYPRLVQPVLDRHCVPCHTKEPKAPALNAQLVKRQGAGGMDVSTSYYASYLSLAPKYAFYNYGGTGWGDSKWYTSTPGEFGALASKLYPMLKGGHHDLKMPAEDWKRITLWLDSCSLFYGVYEKEGAEAQLRGELAQPTLE